MFYENPSSVKKIFSRTDVNNEVVLKFRQSA